MNCRACPRLVSWREQAAREKRAAYRDQTYWGRPVPSFGDPCARVLVVGLAPAAHGANRTGRMFTGDRSGDWLYRAMHRAGLANQPGSTRRDDGLRLTGACVTAVVRCAPPANKPSPAERSRCLGFLAGEIELMKPPVIVCLGRFAWDGVRSVLTGRGLAWPRTPAFAHGAEIRVGPHLVIGSYHPSQQNTFTGRLTEPMLDAVFQRTAQAGRI
jgi:uracil-DNA glycosylase family 4